MVMNVGSLSVHITSLPLPLGIRIGDHWHEIGTVGLPVKASPDTKGNMRVAADMEAFWDAFEKDTA